APVPARAAAAAAALRACGCRPRQCPTPRQPQPQSRTRQIGEIGWWPRAAGTGDCATAATGARTLPTATAAAPQVLNPQPRCHAPPGPGGGAAAARAPAAMSVQSSSGPHGDVMTGFGPGHQLGTQPLKQQVEDDPQPADDDDHGVDTGV